MSTVLETRGLSKRFGGLLATSDVTFQLERGARQALIGPNGAGKTTFVNLLTGVLPPSAGGGSCGALASLRGRRVGRRHAGVREDGRNHLSRAVGGRCRRR